MTAHHARTAIPLSLTSGAVLTGQAGSLDDYTKVLTDTQSAITAPPEGSAYRQAGAGAVAALHGFEPSAWARDHLDGAPGLRERLPAVTARGTLPAVTAACVAAAAVNDAGLTREDLQGCAVIVAGGNLSPRHQAETAARFAERGHVAPSYALTHMDVDVVGTVSQVTGAVGEGWVLGASAAGGALAVLQAARLVASGEVARCLVVAPATDHSAVELAALRQAGALAGAVPHRDPRTLCRPFDLDRSGFVPGQGAAAVLLEPVEDATRRGCDPLALLLGHGQALDGRRAADPLSEGQTSALRRALERAGVDACDVDYVNAHAAGTRLGDEIEGRSLAELFGTRPLVNSTKALTGHCFGASGLLELIATAIQLRDGFCHGNPHLTRPCTEGLTFAPRDTVQADLAVAVSSSYAFCGISCSLVLARARAAAGEVGSPW
ncbi:beta-ketoacyl synthase N-terminal-like domain-containing protein [Streptomyces sp. NPDC007856]|uniref:beta-ketoacyl synthase N-terminal-like domain-containing protein n=1 Tax=Streptomyces sp. NPDC007856 TaxID=3364781 RepID=UPI0036C0D03E